MKTKTQWLLLMYGLPLKASKARVAFWRKLKQIGAVALKNSVYILPYREDLYENFQWLVQEIQSMQGEATLVKVDRIENMDTNNLIQLFNSARDKDYKQIINECRTVAEKLDSLQDQKPSIEEERQLKKIAQRLKEIEEIDFFSASLSRQARAGLEKAGEKLKAALKKPSAVLQNAKRPLQVDKKGFVNKTWVTRKRPHVDRLATSWLIKKFIDPEARFVFVTEGEKLPDGVPFDMIDVSFSHRGDDCTFETMMKTFDIRDRAVREIAQIVHDVDLRDGKFGRLEVKGLDAVLKGLLETHKDDHALLEVGLTLFEALYKSLQK